MVVSTKLEEEARAALIKRFCDLIAEHGAVHSVDEWGKRRLAYEINKETDGYYVLVTFESEPTFIMELERIYRITDNLLRTLVIRLESPNEVKGGVSKEPEIVEEQESIIEDVELEESSEESDTEIVISESEAVEDLSEESLPEVVEEEIQEKPEVEIVEVAEDELSEEVVESEVE